MSVDEIIELIDQKKFEEASKAIFEYGIFEPIDSCGNTFVHYCCIECVPGVIDKISEYAEALDCHGVFEMTPLLLACNAGNVEAVEQLINLGVDINATDEYGMSAMIYALGYKDGSCQLDGSSYITDKAPGGYNRGKNEDEFISKLKDKYNFCGLNDSEYEHAYNLFEQELEKEKRRTNGFRSTEESERLKIVKMLLDAGVIKESDKPDGKNISEISIAIQTGNIECAKLLIEAGYDVNVCKGTGIPPLCEAVKSFDYEVINFLLDAGADIDTEDGYKQSPIALAQYREMDDVVELLLNNLGDMSEDKVSIIRAAQDNDVSAIKKFIKAGASIEQKDVQGNTPLIWAAANWNVEAVKTLIELGADVNAANDGGVTPLHDAADGAGKDDLKRLSTVRILVENGADVNAMSRLCTPINMAIISGDVKIARYLYINGGRLNGRFAGRLVFEGTDISRDNEWSAIWCILNDLPDVAVEIAHFCRQGLQNTLDGGFKEFSGMSFLTIAADNGKKECVEKLLDNCTLDIDAYDVQGAGTALMAAVAGGYLDIADILLERGADFNFKTAEGFSVVDFAHTYYQMNNDMSAVVWVNKHKGC